MGSRAAAFAVLGLKPGADPSEIEAAYRRLIKQYHPDREGGDGVRAAEIIHAYRELRGGRALIDPLQFNEDFGSRRRRGWPALLVAAIVLGSAVYAAINGIPETIVGLHGSAPDLLTGRPPKTWRAASANPMDQPLHLRSIKAAVAEAEAIFHSKDEIALAAASRDCQRRFRDDPSTDLLDRCAAFDNAVIGLQDRDPLRDAGPFAPLTVTGRQWSAASSLSDDYLAIDNRLDKIRVQVELAMAPIPEPEQQEAATNADSVAD